jgi:hypothetical protein
MADSEAGAAIHSWLSRHAGIASQFEVGVRVAEEAAVDKAVATISSPSHVASATVWSSGTLEFIVLDVTARQEVIMLDRTYSTDEELQALLDECMQGFVSLAQNEGTKT